MASADATSRRWPRPGQYRVSWRQLAGVACLLAVGLAVILTAVLWRAGGGRWLVVRTPSMGQAAPVGTLIFTRPVAVSDVHVGDIITFRAPHSSRIVTHRVIATDAAGVRTRGDVNQAPDPYPLHQQDLIGKVVARWWAVGWLLRAVPVLIIGALLLWITTRYALRVRWRPPARILGSATLVTVCALIFRPLVGAQVITTSAEPGRVSARIVSTGLLPIRAHTAAGNHVDLVSGQAGTLTSPRLTGGPYQFSSNVHMTLPWWLLTITVCISPLLWCLLIGLPLAHDPTRANTSHRPRHGPRPRLSSTAQPL